MKKLKDDSLMYDKWNYSSGIRLPEKVAATISKIAKEEYRSMNSVMVNLILAGLEKPRMEELFDRLEQIEKKLDLLTRQKEV